MKKQVKVSLPTSDLEARSEAWKPIWNGYLPGMILWTWIYPIQQNAIDGHFADLKNKLRNHNGLSLERKRKFIDEFFKA